VIDIGRGNRAFGTQERDGDAASMVDVTRALRWARWGTIGVSVALYALACATPALHFATVPPRPGGAAEIWPGYAVALSGMLAVVALQFAWYANLVLPIALLCLALQWWRTALAFATLATLIAANLLFFPFQRIPYSDGPEFFYIVLERPLIGCYLWVANILVTIVGSTAGLVLRRREGRAGTLGPYGTR
jgi:hypothetical protein